MKWDTRPLDKYFLMWMNNIRWDCPALEWTLVRPRYIGMAGNKEEAESTLGKNLIFCPRTSYTSSIHSVIEYVIPPIPNLAKWIYSVFRTIVTPNIYLYYEILLLNCTH